MLQMLTAVPSLTLDLQEAPEIVQSGADSFAGLLQNQLSQSPGGIIQVIDNDSNFDNYSPPKNTFENNLQQGHLQQEPEAIRREYPVQGSIQIKTESGAVESILLEWVDIPVVQTETQGSDAVSSALLNALTGHNLPVSGNTLPQKTATNVPLADLPVSTAIDSAATNRRIGHKLPQSINSDNLVLSITPDVPAHYSDLKIAVVQPDQAGTVVIQPDRIFPVAGTANEPAQERNGSELQSANTGRLITSQAQVVFDQPPTLIKQATDSVNNLPFAGLENPVASYHTSALSVIKSVEPQPPVMPASAFPGHEPELQTATQVGPRIVKDLNDFIPREIVPGNEVVQGRPVSANLNPPNDEILRLQNANPNIEIRNAELSPQASTNTPQLTAHISTNNLQIASPISTVNPAPAIAPQQNNVSAQLETISLARNADSAEWGSELRERVNWMVNHKQNTASIRLDPPTLGKLEIQLKITDNTTTVTIQTQTPQIREFIESVSLRLRDLLQESGYQNVNVDVSQRQDQQQARSQNSADSNAGQQDALRQEQAADQQEREQISYFNGDGLIDTFA